MATGGPARRQQENGSFHSTLEINIFLCVKGNRQTHGRNCRKRRGVSGISISLENQGHGPPVLSHTEGKERKVHFVNRGRLVSPGSKMRHIVFTEHKCLPHSGKALSACPLFPRWYHLMRIAIGLPSQEGKL